jgi:hypothetical protein
MKDIAKTAALRLAGAAAALVLTIAASASAGTFTVSGTNGLWRAYNNRPDRLAVYPDGATLATRNTFGGFSTPAGSEGGWIFDAPSGTSLSSFTLAGALLGNDGWQAALIPAGLPPVENCPGPACPGALQYLWGNVSYGAGGASAIVMRLRCSSTNGCPNQGYRGFAYVYASTVTIADSTPPGVRITGGPLVSNGWHRAVGTVAYDASDNVGIKEMRAYLDGAPRASAPRSCNYSSKTPCPNGGGTLSVDTSGMSDGRHQLTVQAIDTADNAADATQTVNIDNTPPVSPAAAAVQGADAWRSANSFDVTWMNPPQSAAPIAGALYSLCPEANPPTATRGCVRGSRNGSRLTGITGLRVPSEGAWRMRLWLRDAAGNQSETTAAAAGSLRFDATAPAIRFLPKDPEDPARVRVAASDDTSGIAVRQIELRRRGTEAWRPVPVTANPSGFSSLIDDGVLRRGVYEIRARAVDAAGNERSVDERPNGASMRLSLPLRIRTRLAVGVVRHVRRQGASGGRGRLRRVLVRRPFVPFGRRVVLHGRLTTPGGNGVAATGIDVWQRGQLPGSTWRRVGALRTSRTGSFTFRAGRGPSRLLRFRYPGTATIRSRTTTVAVRVRASTSMHVRPHEVFNGEYVTFRGRVRGRPLPTGGKLVELQVFTRRRWRTFAQPRARQSDGRWTYRYRFEAITGRMTFRFRARIRKELGFPYDLGTSRPVRVTVRGA